MQLAKDITLAIAATLKRHNLSVTESRKRILQIFLEEKGALAHGDIERHLK